MNKQNEITLKQLVDLTGAPYYIINYLKETNRLPIAKNSQGRGYPTIYTREAVEIIKQHLAKQDHSNA